MAAIFTRRDYWLSAPARRRFAGGRLLFGLFAFPACGASGCHDTPPSPRRLSTGFGECQD